MLGEITRNAVMCRGPTVDLIIYNVSSRYEIMWRIAIKRILGEFPILPDKHKTFT
jgi:hypothetical protein